jgi:hypothetical protein
MPLNKLIHPSRKKIKKAKEVYDIYCKTGSKAQTQAATGLAYNTIRKYVDLIEDINNRNKLSTKDRYYNNKDNINNNINSNLTPPEALQQDDNIYNNINNNNIYNDNNNINNIISDNNNEDIITNLKDIKNKILLSKLDSISLKYLDQLDNATEEQLEKTSLKDHAVISGILLDKKILLEHKQNDVVKNQSIIFNLFGNNKNLAQFIGAVTSRQAKLREKPANKYILSTNK